MAEYQIPGVYIEEVAPISPIFGAPTGVAGFVGVGGAGPPISTMLHSEREFAAAFTFDPADPLSRAVHAFYENGGERLYVARADDMAGIAAALDALGGIPDIDLVAAPGIAAAAAALVAHVEAPARYRLAVIDPPAGLDVDGVVAFAAEFRSSHTAIYFPWVTDASGSPVAPSGFVAGIASRVEATRGVWKAPANEVIRGASGLQHSVSNVEQDLLNNLGINALRVFPGKGPMVWGARTLSTDPEWRYISVRRQLDWLEKSITEGLRFAIFEPNDASLWSQVRAMVSSFVMQHWQAGGLVGATASEAWFVHCDASTMTQYNLERGSLIVLIGVAPSKPAEFMIFRIELPTADAFGG